MIIKNTIISPINQHLPSQLLTQENDSRQLHVPDVVAVSWRLDLPTEKCPIVLQQFLGKLQRVPNLI